MLDLYGRQAHLWADELRPALAAEGIVVAGVDELNDDEREALDARFDREIYPVLTPLAVGPGTAVPVHLAALGQPRLFVDDPDTGEERFARVKVPEGLPRFLPLGRRGRFVALEQVLAHYLPRLFPGMDVREWSLFRVTRDADLDVSDEADDLLEAVELELRRARFGEVTRLEVSRRCPARCASSSSRVSASPTTSSTGSTGSSTSPISASCTQLDRPDLKNDQWRAVRRPPWDAIETASQQFAAIRDGDLLVHHPYDSFAASFESYIDRAASDPNVIAIKSTVYRTSDDTPLVPALIENVGARASKRCASSRSRRAATSAATSSSHAHSSRRESMSSTASPA